MSGRLGTCRFAFQIQEGRAHEAHTQPHQLQPLEICPEEYQCDWLSFVQESIEEVLPPPVMRRAGGMGLNPGDCENCPHFEPAGKWSLAQIMETSARLWADRKLAKETKPRRVSRPARRKVSKSR
jgi:hypothetical protein